MILDWRFSILDSATLTHALILALLQIFTEEIMFM